MAQALLFINGDLLNRKITADGGLVDRLVKAGSTDTAILDELYWAAFGRAPRKVERLSSLDALHQALAAPVVAAIVAAPVMPKPAAVVGKSQAVAPAPLSPASKPTTGSATPVATVAVPTSPTVVPMPDTKSQNDAARRRVFEDMLWVLVNSKEFLFNH